MRDTALIYTNRKATLDLLTIEQKGVIFDAILCYQTDNALPEMDHITTIVWSVLKQDLDANNDKWDEVKAARSEAGKKGNEIRWAKKHEEENEVDLSQTSQSDDEVIAKSQSDTCDENLSQTSQSDNCDIAKSQTVANGRKASHNVYVNVNVNENVKDKKEVSANADTKKKQKPDTRHKCGSYGRVLLTDEEVERLISQYGAERTEEAIAFLDDYKKRKGYVSKDDNLTLRKWVFDAVEEEKRKKNRQQPRSQDRTPTENTQSLLERWGLTNDDIGLQEVSNAN